MNLGPEASFRVRQAGVVTASLSAAHDDGEGFGAAGLLRYSYQGREWNVLAFLKELSRKYATIGDEERSEKVRTVITSYSIHYTKLYDRQCSSRQDETTHVHIFGTNATVPCGIFLVLAARNSFTASRYRLGSSSSQ